MRLRPERAICVHDGEDTALTDALHAFMADNGLEWEGDESGMHIYEQLGMTEGEPLSVSPGSWILVPEPGQVAILLADQYAHLFTDDELNTGMVHQVGQTSPMQFCSQNRLLATGGPEGIDILAQPGFHPQPLHVDPGEWILVVCPGRAMVFTDAEFREVLE